MTDRPSGGIDLPQVASIAETNAFETALRNDAQVRSDDEAMAQRLLASAAWMAEAPVARRTWSRLSLAVAAAAGVLLLSGGFATARLLDWAQSLADDQLALVPVGDVHVKIAPPRAPAPPAHAWHVPPAPLALGDVNVVVQPDSEPSSPTALFAAANRARSQKQTAQAARLYAQLQRRHPQSAEAQLSYVSLGRLWLDTGKPKPALDAFDAYLRRGGLGPLAHEALAGRALALEKLKRPAAEMAAWRALLQAYPETLLQARAKARLQLLSPSTDP